MKTLLFIGGIGMQEVLLIALVILLFFGGKKIPELMKGLGKGIKSFKEGMSEVTKDMEDEKKDGNKSELLGSSRPAADDNHCLHPVHLASSPIGCLKPYVPGWEYLSQTRSRYCSSTLDWQNSSLYTSRQPCAWVCCAPRLTVSASCSDTSLQPYTTMSVAMQ